MRRYEARDDWSAEAYSTVRRALSIERNEVVAHLSRAFAVTWYEMRARVEHSGAEAAVLDCVRNLLRELGSEQAAPRATLTSSLDSDLGLGSLERVELLVRVEVAAGVRLADGVAQSAETPGEWVTAVAEAEGRAGVQPRFPIVQPAREAAAPPVDAVTFAEVLRRHAEHDPARVQIHLLDQDRGEDISYGLLYERASAVAAGLASSGLKPGETVAIMLPTCDDFFYSFLGVMLSGGIAVPIYPPARPSQIEEYVRRQTLILRNAGVRFLISFERVRAVSKLMELSLPTLKEVITTSQLVARGRAVSGAGASPAEIFFIQYTSGSTGNPKGVTLTHSNVLANVRGIGWAVNATPADVVVSWLPLYHDMGLIGSWLFSLYHGFPITVMSPLDFLARPERWLWALSDSGGTLCPAPNFSFELCARKISDEALEGVDLSKWHVVINAGEPVLPSTLKRFSERFSPIGFDARGFIPCYGLAESSVALTFPPMWRDPLIDNIDRATFELEGRAVSANAGTSEDTLQFVANGVALPEHQVRIVDSDGADLPERTRGRVIFRGPSRTQGYFRNPEATAAAIDPHGWMDSGDLGYIADGEIYITGRLKDCIIKAGHNIIPQDVEMAAWEVEGIRKGCVAAFGTVDQGTGTEKLVVVAETRVSDPSERRRVAGQVVDVIATKIGIPPDDVVLSAPESVPKTSSGKIRRAEMRRLYEAGEIANKRRAAPGVQVAKLWFENAGGWLASAAGGLAAEAQSTSLLALQSAIAISFGMAARLAPFRGLALPVIRPAARWLAALSGLRVEGSARSDAPCVWPATRAHRLDPLIVAAQLRSPFVFADSTGWAQLPSFYAFLLDPLVADTELGLEVGVLASLEAGYSVIAFADNPVGETVARSRFRLEPLAAASTARAHVAPLRIAAIDTTITLTAAEPIRDAGPGTEIRTAVRASLVGA